MEGVGARLGRSSTRYGPATVFTGPVRRWKKKWVHVASPSSSTSSASTANHSQLHNLNGTSNVSNVSHLLLYKWTPITQSQNAAINGNSNNTSNGNGDEVPVKDDSALAAPEEPPRRKFKYVPIAVLEEQKTDSAEDEAAEKVEDEAKPIDVDADASTKDGGLDEKPDINDVPMEENQNTNQVVRQDLNVSTLDLSLGLNGHDGDNDPDSNTDHN
ncbi:hypothetical protein UlMin_018022 [Ulmus minor]